MRTALLAAFLVLAAGVSACQGCHSPDTKPVNGAADSATKPTVRFYVVSSVAGALEPCGCTKDQLGGVDHLAAYVAGQKGGAPDALMISAGPLLFMDPTLAADRATQDTWKAEAIALAAKDMGLVGWAPGLNDFAAGSDKLGQIATQAGAKIVAANLGEKPQLTVATVVKEVGGIKVGIVGVSDPKDRLGKYPDGVKAEPSIAAMKKGIADVKGQGARIFVGLAALPRGEALRLADAVPELHLLAIGKPVEAGDVNDAPKAPIVAGTTVVVETSNHLQTAAVVDFYVRGDDGKKALSFADAGGVAKADDLLSLAGRIRDLENRINSWEKDKGVDGKDVIARKYDLEKLRADKAKLEEPAPPPPGSFFRYTSVEVREKLGSEKQVAERMLAYYKRVDEHNKTAFADRVPPPVEKGKASYIGVEECTTCHDDARKVWDKTPHANAYGTLAKQFKEYNLDCVSCHVTGYGQPGGSTVTHVEKLVNVGCEECHGPGSLHVKDTKNKELIIAKPNLDTCVSKCHHPPHVEGFDPKEKVKNILGKGHGLP